MVETYGRKATRHGYAEALVELGAKNPKIISIGADTACSVMVNLFAQKFPDRSINLGIAEQNMIGVASGLAISGWIPFATTYSVFASGRPWEEIRTTVCYSNLNIKIGGSHGGLLVGPDGATHQALEEIAIMRCLPNMVVMVPCDVNETKKATFAAAEHNGPVFIRFGRESVPVITKPEAPFRMGKADVLRDGKDVAIIACGYMVYESLMAADLLAKKGVSARVINIHTVKPIDSEEIVRAAKECGAIVTAEEHQLFGGFGSAVAEVVVQKEPVPMEMVGIHDRFGESGEPFQLIEKFNLKDVDIAAAAERAFKRK